MPSVIAAPMEIQNNFGIRLKGTGYFMIAPAEFQLQFLLA